MEQTTLQEFWGWAWGWENWQNWNGGSYWYPWAWGTQTWRWNWGNTRSEQFRWWGWSWTYWFGWGWWWRWWNGSWWDGSWDDDAQAGWGSGYVLSSATDRVLTQGGWSAAGQDWSVKIRYLVKERPQPKPKARLPHEYQEVEYIESSWNWTWTWQYIDTWISIESWASLKVEIDFHWLNNTTDERDIFAYYQWQSNDYIIWFSGWSFHSILNSHNKWTLPSTWTPNTYSTNTRYKVIAEWTTNSSSNTPYLFASNENGSRKRDISAKLYYCKVWKNNNLIRDYVPCYRISDWAAWLYDLVEWKFYTNSWTWAFKRWAPVNVWEMPNWYTELQYIQSDWTSCWINTGITPHDTSFFEIEFKMNPTALKSSGNYFYWTASSWAWNSFEYTSSSSSSYWNVWSSTLIWALSPNLSTWTDYIFDCKYSWNNWWTLTVSWTYSKSVNYSWSTWTKPLYFFCAWDDLTAQSAEKLYYLKIYTWDSEANKSLVRDFVPCVRDSDWVIWLYDLVTNEFFANAWTWNFVAGPVIFRNGFVPSYRTVWYFPLVDNVDDIANWLSLTTSWTKEDLWRTFTATTTFSNRENTKPTKFVSVFLKINSWLNGTGCCTQLFDLWETPCCYVTSHSDSSLRNTVHYSNWSSTWPHAWTGIVQWQWFHLCYWYYGWTIIMRVNGTKTTIWGGCTWTNWWNDFIRINGDWLNITCSDYIMEKEWWTDEQVADYLNAKKALYWIS